MCGIFGVVRFEGYYDEKEISAYQKAVDVVAHRGPDDLGCNSLGFPDTNGKNVFLGHRRLSIIDRSQAAHQPFEDNGIWVTYNGEIFNFIEIRETLRKLGYHFKTSSDTEVILKVYQHYGHSGFDLFNGMWAFLLFDSGRGVVIASRDRFSIKPLYYFKNDNSIFFASEIRQLLPFTKERKPNLPLLTVFLIRGVHNHSDETFFEGIYQVPPKSNMIMHLRTGEVSFEKYWNYENTETLTQNQAIEKFKNTFEESVKIRLRGDVEVGSLLSGGLDSSVISMTANEFSEKPLKTFSIISSDKRLSEEKFVDILVGDKKLWNKKILFNEQRFLESLEKCLLHQEQPFINASVVAQYMIFELLHKETDIKVVLSGQGADEILMGYQKYFFFYMMDLARKKQFGNLVAEFFYSLYNRTAITQLQITKAKRYIPWLKQSHIKVSAPPVQLSGENSIKAHQIRDIDFLSVPALMHYEDRNAMAHSIESRPPFLDHNLVNLLIQMPDDLKFKNGWSKYLLRKTFPNLPEKIAWRRDKKNFSVPQKQLFSVSLKDEIKTLGKNSLLAEMGILDQKKFIDNFHHYLRGYSWIDTNEIFSIFITERWLRNYWR